MKSLILMNLSPLKASKQWGNQFAKDKVKTINITIPEPVEEIEEEPEIEEIESDEEILKKERLKIYFRVKNKMIYNF